MKVKIEIKHWMTSAVLFEYECEDNTLVKTIREANLRDADLSGANLSDAEFMGVKFYGKGGTKPLKQSQLKDFLAALGFVIENAPKPEEVRDTVAVAPVKTADRPANKKIKIKIAGVIVEGEIVEE